MDIEDAVMAAGYRSCFGCTNRGNREICSGCSVVSSRWEPNERWTAAQNKEGRNDH